MYMYITQHLVYKSGGGLGAYTNTITEQVS